MRISRAFSLQLSVFSLCVGLCACAHLRPQRGGGTTTTLGGATGPTVVTTTAPENPQTPSTTLLEKTITREWLPNLQTVEREAPPAKLAKTLSAASARSALEIPVRETVSEKSTTITGTAQKETARELGARLANMRGVLWVGVALLIAGPVVGWRLGWLTNGLIAGAVGLLLVILAQVIPGNEVWFGLFGLLAIPVVAFVYYRAHHDATTALPPPQKAEGLKS